MKATVFVALAAALALSACQKETPVVVEPAQTQTPVVVTTPPADVTVVTPPAASAEASAPVEAPAEEKK